MAKRILRFLSAVMLTTMLALTLRAADEQGSSIASEYKRLNQQFEDAREEYFKAYERASEEERENLKYPDQRKHAKELLRLAEKDPKDPAALDALVDVVMHARYDQEIGPKATELLRVHHLESEKLDRVCQMFGYSNQKEQHEFLELALEKNPHAKVKGAAALSLGNVVTRKDPKKAEQYFNDVIKKYGTKEQKEKAKGELFEMHNLAVGKVAPEIKGKDVDGKAFKLSDYRGKVVVLDFWGDW